MQQYRIIALDLDGTLTDSEKKITPKTKEALHSLIRTGVRLVLASGRPVCGILPVAEELGLPQLGGYILAFNGARMIECQSGEVIEETCLSTGQMREILDFVEEQEAVCLTYDGADIISEHPEDPYVQLEGKINRATVRGVDSLKEKATKPVNKYLIVGSPEKMERLELQAKERFGHELSVFRSEPYFLEVLPKGLDKASALARLLEKTGEGRENLMAFGDGYNDISMMSYAGLGIAMGNAQEVVKKAADYVTLSNDEDGIAAALEHFHML